MIRVCVLACLLVASACVPRSTSTTEADETSTPAASLHLRTSAGERELALGEELELLFCRWDREPERGDYVWIRLGETAEKDGDAGPHLDLDVCRLTSTDTGPLGLMPPGQHGSRCAPEPGFALWWHEGDTAFVSPVAGKTPQTPCTLKLEHTGEWLSGRFSCESLYAVEDASAGPSILSGSFSCPLTPMPQK